MFADPSWFNKKNSKVIAFASIFIILGVINYLIKHSPLQYFLIPFMAIYACHYLEKFKFKFVTIDIIFIFLYLFYYNVYFSILPNIFIHPSGFDENLFLRSSSNAIAISLNTLLYIYIILALIFNQKKYIYLKLFLISIINLVLILIQQSRAGIFIAILLIFIIIYQYSRTYQIPSKIKYISILFFAVAMTVFIYQYYVTITDYISIIGNVSGISAYEEDVRSSLVKGFFADMDLNRLILGYPNGFKFGGTDYSYTYNTFLDVWNNYTIIAFFTLSIVIIKRFLFYKRYFFPIYILLPFLIYSFGEPRFLPSYWDFSIYLLLFKKK